MDSNERKPKRLFHTINKTLFKKEASKRARTKWFYVAATTVAAALLIVAIKMVGPVNKTNMAFAMEQAYKGLKAYHGILEVTVTNSEGKSVTQSKIEVWADKEGHYYVKGLEGVQKDLITVNDGQKKWQIQPMAKEIDVFPAFPDPYSFTFEIGKEIEDIKSAVKTEVIGEAALSGRAAEVMEVTPQGGNPYRLWIDKETKMPLKKQSEMENSHEYKEQYVNIDFAEAVPRDLLIYNVPKGFKEINTNTEQIVNTLEEAIKIVGFVPKVIENIPLSFSESSIAVDNSSKAVKINYVSEDNSKKISIFQKKASDELKPAPLAILGKINNTDAEIQSPVQDVTGVLQGVGAYVGITGLNSVRWQQEGIEYAVVGNTSLEVIKTFIKELANGSIELSSANDITEEKPNVEVPVDLQAERGDQKSVDAGHSPWRLDPVFVSQVFVSLKISPEGIQGDYPINYDELKVVKNNGKEAVVEVGGSTTPIRMVYLKRLVRQDNTGIWTVVGYDPISSR